MRHLTNLGYFLGRQVMYLMFIVAVVLAAVVGALISVLPLTVCLIVGVTMWALNVIRPSNLSRYCR